jgi:hypothetical protein
MSSIKMPQYSLPAYNTNTPSSRGSVNSDKQIRNPYLSAQDKEQQLNPLLEPLPVLGQISDNPRNGFFWYFVHSLILCMDLFTMKGIFILNPDLSVIQVGALKGALSFSVILLYCNSDLKRIMYDSVDHNSIQPLSFKIF